MGTACVLALFIGLAARCRRYHQQSEQLGARLFALYDQNRDAHLNSVELVKYLSDHGVNISSLQASSWLAVVDDEADGFDIGRRKRFWAFSTSYQQPRLHYSTSRRMLIFFGTLLYLCRLLSSL